MAGRQVLAQLGTADVILSGQPDITLFLEQYKPQGLFASRVINVQFENEPAFGTDSTVDVPLSGDLITSMYVRMDLTFPYGTAFYDAAGTLMIERVELYSGNQLIERMWGEFITLLNEVEVPYGQQPGLTEIIGGSLIGGGNAPLARYTIPIKFKCLQAGLPVTPNMRVRIILNDISNFCTDPATPIKMSFNFFSEYIFLSENEREYIQRRGPVIHLSENVQRAMYVAPAGTSNIRCMTNFLHPVKELFFTVQNQGAKGFDYLLDSSNIAGPSYSLNFSNINQLNAMAMYFNEAERIDPLIGTNLLLGTSQFLEYHTRVPTKPFYMYSFSLDPESPKPSGAVNFGRIKNQYFDFYLAPHHPGLRQGRVVTIWARYYQFLEVDGFKKIKVMFDNMDESGQSSFIV
jgi:hypothetical protein